MLGSLLATLVSPGPTRAAQGMPELISTLTGLLLKAGIVAIVVNEVRGFVLAGPVLYGMYAAGGTWTALWIGFCSIAGIFLSVVAPLFIARKLKLLPARAPCRG